MLKIGVRLPGPVDDVGEYLADIRALEAAGADSIWLDPRPGQDPLMMLAAASVVTNQLRLGITSTPADLPADTLSERWATLQRLSGGRGISRIASPEQWLEVAAPESRASWRETRRACEEAGATGVIVPWSPRLLDLLRRPDEEDDRSDLLLAQG
jgi:hypothetical protein